MTHLPKRQLLERQGVLWGDSHCIGCSWISPSHCIQGSSTLRFFLFFSTVTVGFCSFIVLSKDWRHFIVTGNRDTVPSFWLWSNKLDHDTLWHLCYYFWCFPAIWMHFRDMYRGSYVSRAWRFWNKVRGGSRTRRTHHSGWPICRNDSSCRGREHCEGRRSVPWPHPTDLQDVFVCTILFFLATASGSWLFFLSLLLATFCLLCSHKARLLRSLCTVSQYLLGITSPSRFLGRFRKAPLKTMWPRSLWSLQRPVNNCGHTYIQTYFGGLWEGMGGNLEKSLDHFWLLNSWRILRIRNDRGGFPCNHTMECKGYLHIFANGDCNYFHR